MKLNEALTLHKYDEVESLQLYFLPNRLVDEEYCKALSNRLMQRCNGKWEKYLATPTLANTLPDKNGIYMFVWKLYFPFIFDEDTLYIRLILYIGKAGDEHGSGTIKSRYRNEYSKYVKSDAETIWKACNLNTRSERLTKYLNLHDLEYWFLVMDNCDDRSEILKLEIELIKLFNPPANKTQLRVKYSKTVNAFQ